MASQRDRIKFFAWPTGSRMNQPLPSYFLFCSPRLTLYALIVLKHFVSPNMRSVVSSFCAVALSSAWNFWSIIVFGITTLYSLFNTHLSLNHFLKPSQKLQIGQRAPLAMTIVCENPCLSLTPQQKLQALHGRDCALFFLPSKQLARCLENSKCFSKSTSYSPPHGD